MPLDEDGYRRTDLRYEWSNRPCIIAEAPVNIRLLCKEGRQVLDDFLRMFFRQPMPGVGDDDTPYVIRILLNLLSHLCSQAVVCSYSKNGHRHFFMAELEDVPVPGTQHAP